MEQTKLEEIQQQMKFQYGRATAEPIFIVYDYDKIPVSEDYNGDWEYI